MINRYVNLTRSSWDPLQRSVVAKLGRISIPISRASIFIYKIVQRYIIFLFMKYIEFENFIFF